MCFISWLVSLSISCLVFVHPVLWLGTGPWPLHTSRCQHFVWSSNTYNYSDSNSRWAGLGGKNLQSLAISGTIHTSQYGIFRFQKRTGNRTKRTMKPISHLRNGSLSRHITTSIIMPIALYQMTQLLLICWITPNLDFSRGNIEFLQARLDLRCLFLWHFEKWSKNTQTHYSKCSHEAKMPTIDQWYSKYFQPGYWLPHPPPPPLWNWLNSKQTSRGRRHVESSVVVSCPRWHPSEIAHLFPLMDAGLSH